MMGRGTPCVSLFLIVLLNASALAQSPPDSPSFRAGTTLIEFTVVATGEHGRRVTDLKQEDLSIVEGGRPREVAFFHYEGAPPATIRVRSQPYIDLWRRLEADPTVDEVIRNFVVRQPLLWTP